MYMIKSIGVNKKKVVVFFLVAWFVVLVIGGVVYYISSMKRSKFSYVQKKSDTSANVIEEKKIVFPEYVNKKYGYATKYPNDWHVVADDAESDLVAPDAESGIEYPLGGQVFWSNYANIDDYGPEDKPDDFRLLGLVVYQGGDEIGDDFAKKIGVFENSTKVDFKTEKSLVGSQFISVGLTENDLKITVIFKKDKLFYVFTTAFINGDEKAASIMENIIKSFMF